MSFLNTKPGRKDAKNAKLQSIIRGEKQSNIHCQIDTTLLRKFKTCAMEDGISMKEMISRLITKFLKERK